MQVNIEFETTDDDGQVSKSHNFAIMEKNRVGYRLVYVEDLSGEGKMTRSTMVISPYEMRIIRKGELNMDFIYGPNMVHNTSYMTPYGNFPVTLETQSYSYDVQGKVDTPNQNIVEREISAVSEEEKGFAIRINIEYALSMSGQAPMNMGMKICITKREVATI